MDIKPTIGFDDIKLGMSRERIEALLGAPAEAEIQPEYETWKYPNGIEITFSNDDDNLASWISLSSEEAKLEQQTIIGLSEAELLQAFPFLSLDEDFAEDGKDYVCSERELSVWLKDDKVIEVSLFPAFDVSGEHPQWPD